MAVTRSITWLADKKRAADHRDGNYESGWPIDHKKPPLITKAPSCLVGLPKKRANGVERVVVTELFMLIGSFVARLLPPTFFVVAHHTLGGEAWASGLTSLKAIAVAWQRFFGDVESRLLHCTLRNLGRPNQTTRETIRDLQHCFFCVADV